MSSAALVFVVALGTAVAPGLGALPFAFRRPRAPRRLGAAHGRAFGVLIALAIAIQNIPEGLAISLVLVPRGASARAAAAWSIFSSLPQPLLAVPAFLFVDHFTAVLPV